MLRVIQEALDLTKVELQRELDMDRRTIDKLIADTEDDPWRLDRGALHRYFLFAHSHGYDPFQIEPHEIWKSFKDSEATIFRGPNKADVPVENHLVKYFERISCEVNTTISSADPTEEAVIRETMREQNCVIIGSPKANPASEVVLSLLWQAEPFKEDVGNREKIPISFLGMHRERKEPSALLQDGARHGIYIRTPESRERKLLKVNWLPLEKFGPHKGSGQDAAVLVGCYQPMGTEKEVTTIVIAGYTGLATLVAAQEVTYKEIPELRPEEMPGRPCLAALKFRYKKRPQSQYKRALDNLRSFEEGSSKWAPPWHEFFS